jgi:hypothetical protein
LAGHFLWTWLTLKRRALEHGVEFIAENGGGPGVRLKKAGG